MRGGERSVGTERVALEGCGVFVEVEVAAVLQPEPRAAGEHQRQVGVAVTVAVAHAAAEERHRRVEHGLAVDVLGLCEAVEEVAELLDGEGVVLGELFHVNRVACVVAQLMPRLGDADFRDGNGVPLAAHAEGGHARHIGLEGEHHEVIDCAEVIACHGGGDVAVGAFTVGVGNGGQRGVEPGVGLAGADLRLADGGEILLHAAFVGGPQPLLKPAHFGEVGVEDTALGAQGEAAGGLASGGFTKQGVENLAASAQRRQVDAVGGPGERVLVDGDLHGGVAGVFAGDFGHLLIHGDGVAIRWAELAAGEPDLQAVVVVAEAARVVQAADRGDHFAELLQRLERAGELIVLAGLENLVVQRMDAVGEVDEGAAPWRGDLLRRAERDHAFQKRQRDDAAERLESMAAVDEPGLGLDVHGSSLFLVLCSWFFVLGSLFLVEEAQRGFGVLTR